MNSLYYINISLEIFCCIICLVLLLCVITTEYKKVKLNRIFISLILCLIPLLLIDILIVVLEGSTALYAPFVFQTAYFFSFIIGSVLLILFTYYLIAFMAQKTSISRNTIYVSYVAIATCIINIICIVLTQFNHMYYFVDENNFYNLGEWYLLSQILAFICISLNTGIMIAYRKSLQKREMVFLLSYTALPTLALVIQNMVEGTIASIDFAATLTILIFYAGIQSEQAKKLEEKELEISESRIAIMLSQIQPHFLYNSLVVIKQLCDIDPKEAKEAVTEFSSYLRGNLDSLTLRQKIPFEKELEHVRTYLSLEQKRFGDKLHVEFDTKVQDFLIPSLTLQPIVENAVRYGVTKREHSGTVTIKTEEVENDWLITVIDDGVGFDPANPKQDGYSHIGIENVQSRLHSMCGGTLEIESVIGSGTTAYITIPKGGKPYEGYSS